MMLSLRALSDRFAAGLRSPSAGVLFGIVTGLCLSLSVPAFAANVCLIAPNGGGVYVRNEAGERIGNNWKSYTLATADDNELAALERDGYLYVVTPDNESGYVSHIVVKNEQECEKSVPTKPTPAPTVTPTPGEGSKKPTPPDVGSSDPFGCGTGTAAAKCNRDSLYALANRSRNCTDYSSAREIVYLKIDAKVDAKGNTFVESVYSNDTISLRNGMPDANVFNIEHTWPQSKLKMYNSFSETRSDMYHLFPSENRINSIRGNHPFREIPGEPEGHGRLPETDGSSFEPPEQHKGYVARAMFYMAVAYDMEIDSAQEKVLRDWHVRFPVTEEERERARKVETHQGNVNPFIENPEFVNLVADF